MMLTAKENFLATLNGEKAERYVNQFEYLKLVRDPIMSNSGRSSLLKPGSSIKDGWGVEIFLGVDQPGSMPVHGDKTVVKDIEDWKDYVTAPKVLFTDEEWDPFVKAVESVNRDEQMVSTFIFPGVFERFHYLCSMEDTLCYLITDPEPVHELIDYITDWELAMAQEQIKHLHPDAVFHHDDFGSQLTTIMSPEMFREFLVPAYKKIYGFYKENGVIVVHHSDTYAATIVEDMIDMGVRVWQGCLSTNDLPKLIEKYGSQMCFMGGIDAGKIDLADWTPESVRSQVEEVCTQNGNRYFIPCTTHGGPQSVFPGVYDCISKEIDRMSSIMFP